MAKIQKTYKFYDKKGRRLSIYAVPKGDTLEITVIPCSLNEPNFIKANADALFRLIQEGSKVALTGYQTFTTPVVDGKTGWSLINWCRARYGWNQMLSLQVMCRVKPGYVDERDWQFSVYEPAYEKVPRTPKSSTKRRTKHGKEDSRYTQWKESTEAPVSA